MGCFVLPTCNILIVVEADKAGIHHSKYCMPIHYDTIEGGQNKTSHGLFSNYNVILRSNTVIIRAYTNTIYTAYIPDVFYVICKKETSIKTYSSDENGIRRCVSK